MSARRARIRRVDRPTAGVTKAQSLIPALVTIHWADGMTEDRPAIVRAWTSEAVLVEWRTDEEPHEPQIDWVPAASVRRTFTASGG